MNQDQQIQDFLQNNEISKKYSWNDSAIKSTSTFENPFNFLIIKNIITKDGFKDKPIIKMFSEDCFTINFNDSNQKIKQNSEERNIISKKEIENMNPAPQPNKEINYSIASSFVSDLKLDDYFYHPISKFKIKEAQLFNVSLTNFQLKGCELFEPILFTAFLLNEKSPISEFWNFVPYPTQILMEKLNNKVQLNQKASFRIASTNLHTSLVILVTRIAQPSRGAACDKAYSKSSSSQLKAVQESLSNSFDNLFQPFAVTFCPLYDILSNCTSGDSFTMPPPCKIDLNKTKLKDLPSIYQAATKYPFEISLTGKMQVINDQSSILKDGYIELQSLDTPKPGPNFQFHHKLTLSLVRSTFSKKPSKEIFCIVSYCEGGFKGKRKPYIRAKYASNLVSMSNSFASERSEKSIVFNDQFTIELPPTVSDNTYITLEFMSVSFKKKKNELFGIALIPLIVNGGFVRDGKHGLNIFDSLDSLDESEWKSANKQNRVVVRTHLFSSLVSTDPRLNELFDGLNTDLSKSDPSELLRNIFQVVGILTNRIATNDAANAINSFEMVAFRIAQFYDEFEEFLMFYALNFAHKAEGKEDFHRNLLSSWGKKLLDDAKKSPGERFDVYLVNFYFMLIIKSIYVTNDKNINDIVLSFVKNWSSSISPLIEKGLNQAKKFYESLGHFLNMLSEIGFYSLVLDCIEICMNSFGNSENDQIILNLLFKSTFTPKLFGVTALNSEKLPELVLFLIEKAKENPFSENSLELFNLLINLFSYYDQTTSQLICKRLMKCFNPLCQLFTILTAKNEIKRHSSFVFFLFLLSNTTLDPFKKWWKSADSSIQSNFFEHIHFLIDNIKYSENETKLNELHYSMNFSILHIIELIIEIDKGNEKAVYSPAKPLTTFSQVTKVIYHLLCSNLVLDAFPVISAMMNNLAKKKIGLLFNQCCPVLPKFLAKVISNGQYWPDILTFIDSIHHADKKFYKNNNRTLAVMTRAIYLTSLQNGTKGLKLIKSKFIIELVTKIVEIDEFLSSNNSIEFEDYCDLLYQKSELLKNSPDAQYEVLSQIAELEHNQEYYAEEIQIFLFQASLVMEYLVLLNKIPKSLFGFEHAANVMKNLSSIYDFALCSMKSDELPLIPSFCDSPNFTFYSLIKIFDKIIDICNKTRYFETSGELVDLIWPLLEHQRAFSLLQNLLIEQADSFDALSKIPVNEDRLFGKYYRVSFYGKLFQRNDKKVFIYREKKLTHLYEISSRIVDSFKKLHGEDKIELIKESGPVDVNSLDPDKGYIQVTFVEPFKNSLNCSSQFFFDTPFIKGNDNKKAQGTVDQQWLRRTVLVVDRNMPFVLKRQKVANVKTIEIEPIRVSYRQLRERVAAMREAVNSQDMRQVQQLLHGSLLVQVNEGPTKMAEVFLGKDKEETKYTMKMKNEFKEFLRVNQEGLKLHAHWCMENTEFIPLQRELDSGFESLKEKLESYLN